MDLTEAIKVLERHQLLRKGAEIEPTDPKKLTEAIDIITTQLNSFLNKLK